MPDRLSLDLNVNGEIETVTVRTSDTLLSVLRDKLHLTGAKRGCNQGVCGTCTVLINGEPMRGCLTLAVECEDAEIQTIEGLGEGGELSSVQMAFINTGAIQCGFCSSGMILTVTSLLKENPTATKEDIREGISGNLCRCTGYGKILEAALNALDGKSGEISR